MLKTWNQCTSESNFSPIMLLAFEIVRSGFALNSICERSMDSDSAGARVKRGAASDCTLIQSSGG